MANYTYKLENGEYVFYEDDKVLKTPNDVVVKTVIHYVNWKLQGIL